MIKIEITAHNPVLLGEIGKALTAAAAIMQKGADINAPVNFCVTEPDPLAVGGTVEEFPEGNVLVKSKLIDEPDNFPEPDAPGTVHPDTVVTGFDDEPITVQPHEVEIVGTFDNGVGVGAELPEFVGSEGSPQAIDSIVDLANTPPPGPFLCEPLPADTKIYEHHPDGTATQVSPALDTAGIPWDERIHAGTKTTVKDGTWKFKPRVDPIFKAGVLSELRAANPEPAAPTVTPTGDTVPTPEQAFAPAAATPVVEDYGWVHMMQDLAAAVSNGITTQEACTAVMSVLFKEFGVTGLPDLQNHEDKIVAFRERLNDIIGPRV